MSLKTSVTLFLLIFCLTLTSVGQDNGQPNRAALEAMGRGAFPEAIRILDKDIKGGRNLFASYSLRSDLRMMTRDFAGALADLNEAIAIAATDGQLYERRARLRLMANSQDMAGVLNDLDLAIANNRKLETIYSLRGMIRSQTGDIDGAIDDYRLALQMRPDLAQPYVGLASQYKVKKDIDRAIETLEGFVNALETSGKKVAVVKGTVTASTSVGLPQMSKDKNVTGQEFVVITRQDSVSGPPSAGQMEKMAEQRTQSKNTALAYSNLASYYEEKGDLDKALKTVDKGISIDPTDFIGLDVRGRIKIGLGDYTGAIADLDRSISLVPRAFQAYASRGIAYLFLGKEAEAQRDFDTYLEQFPRGKEYLEKRISAAREKMKR